MVTDVGFIGLGHMGSVLAANLAAAGWSVIAHDAAGPAKCPEGCAWAGAAEEVAARAGIVVFSLPDGQVSEEVARSVSAAPDLRTTCVVDTSTIGVRAAESICSLLGQVGIAYVDAPVSGGVAGARARTLMVMYAGGEADCAQVESVLAGLSDRRQRVGERPGMAQALKLANNFLSASALAATSEAISFGLSVGLDMATMLQVLNGASGQSQATTDKFPNHVLTGRYGSGFANSLMSKDVRLYTQEVQSRHGPHSMAAVTDDVWQRFADAEPGVDFTRIFPFVAENAGGAVGGAGE